MLSTVEGMLSAAVITCFGLLWPAYSSFKILSQNGDVKPMISYWVVYAIWSVLVSLLESFAFSAIPLWHLVKCGSLVYVAVQPQKAAAVYDRFVEPMLKQHEAKIDQGLEKAKQVAQEKSSAALEEANKMYQNGTGAAGKMVSDVKAKAKAEAEKAD